ncbi:CHAT domain-containing protein [Fervidibacter sacchari]|uniref:CHAT domain-containing protein/Tfp pilus assembly protein PilF n=1 Tax=Candidatus Fervidibacter sacchari TaxID=1448929 RepID=A0ABT2EK74_9BACT|nr:CHAT domain-containing protein [Candidatus Fervidibacter sacchari]MCS3918331.1 CHAT domain-containing protein/Tfp pilus assembly protein PilF [Candidatus Fervidibacter sacchari]WKU16126.1 CHAT domain-containing protein [Candidatus Fervidibacter sacchari]
MLASVHVAVKLAEAEKKLVPEAELYWALDGALAQGQTAKAKQIVEANAELARRLHANLLFVQSELKLDLEDAAPISPRMDEIATLLDLVSDESLRLLANAVAKLPDANLLQINGDELSEALAKFVQGLRSENADEQINLFQTALQKCDALGLELGKLLCLHRLAVAEREKGDLQPAFVHANQVRNLIPRWNYSAFTPAVLNNLGVIAYRLGLMETARQNFLAAFDAAEKHNIKRLQGMILTNLSAVAIQLGNFRQAADFLQQVLTFGKTVARLNNLGALHTYLRDYESALLAFREALELARQRKDISRQVLIWNNIGGLYWLQGNYEQALSCLKQASALAEQTGDLFRVAPIHLTFGLIYAEMGEFEKAEHHFSELLRISRQIGDRLREVGALSRLGFLHIRQKRWDEAIKLLEEASEIAAKSNHLPNHALALLNLGVALEGKGELEAALKAYQEALKIWQDISDPWMQAWAWKNIGDVNEKLAERLTGKERERYWLQAIDAYWRSVRLMEQVREGVGKEQMQALFAQSASEPFYRLVNLLAQMGRAEEAFEVAERMKAQALLELVRFASLLEQEPAPNQVASEYQTFQRRITELEEQLAEALSSPKPNWERVSQLRQELVAARDEFERWRDLWRLQRWKILPVRKGRVTFGAWKGLPLPSDAAVLEYVVTEKRTWVFVLQRKGTKWQIDCYDLPVPQKQLEEDIAWLQGMLVQRRPVGATLQRLYATLFAPIEKSLQGKRWLIIVPDGALFALPFQALQDSEGTYLAERFAIVYAPSLTTLWALNSQSRASSSDSAEASPFRKGEGSGWLWTGLAVTSFESGLEPLPFARQEVQSIASLLNRQKLSARALIGNEATEEKALKALKESRWVHFATHAFLEPTRPLYSRLVLKADQKHDGMLRAFEVLDAGQLASEMVVLSACETGLGKTLKGEGLMGLVWVFLATGTKTLVVSQWQVNDLSAARLMAAYYRHMLKGLPPAEALRRSQVELLSQRPFHHPYFWAAFAVWGKGF